MDELFDRAQRNSSKKLDITPEEADRFKKAFQDPEFCKLMEEYVAEMQNPETRAETESYISQLEGENKVPEGKELIRPEPCFVAKTKKTDKGKAEEKIFINIVQSSKIMPPTKHVTPEGQRWSLPYSLGPPHMEVDNNKHNVVTFDCCFHPEATKLCNENKRYRDMLINTAVEGIEVTYKRQNIITKVSAEYRVLKGLRYKSGQVPTMLVDIASKNNWSTDKEAEAAKAPTASPSPPTLIPTEKTLEATAKDKKTAPVEPAIKKGFLEKAATKEKAKRQTEPVASPSMIQEVTSCTQANTTPVGPIAPKYTMTERGVVSLGDFEEVGKQFVGSSRPAEIIYRFELPKVLKPSQVQLDVAERALKLSYCDVYDVAVQLPYPVFDKKGSAKYDKVNKTLTITLPVRPPPAVVVSKPASTSPVETLPDCEEETTINKSASQATQNTKKSVSSKDVSHARWVQQQQEEEESRKLREEIQRKVKEAEVEAQNQTMKSQLAAASSVSAQTTSVMEKNNFAVSQEPFIKQSKFAGHKKGYVFKNGEHGVGYYLDKRGTTPLQPTKAVDSTASPASMEADKPACDIPFDFRQTKQVISMIVNVPNIVADTVKFHCAENEVDIKFEAVTGENRQHYAGGWCVAAALDGSKCTFDVAAKNMAVVLVKRSDTYVTDSPLLTQRPYLEETSVSKKVVEKVVPSEPSAVIATENMQFSASSGLFDLD